MREFESNLFHEYVSMCMEPKFSSFILENFVVRPFYSRKGRIMLVLVPKSLANIPIYIPGIRVVGSGILCGWIDKERFAPTPHLFNFSRRFGFKFGCSVVVKPQGVKAFLYGNDVLLASFDHFIEPVKRGGYVAVLDSSDMRAVGIGILLVDRHDVERLARDGMMLSVVVKNVFDLGIHIRDEEFFLG